MQHIMNTQNQVQCYTPHLHRSCTQCMPYDRMYFLSEGIKHHISCSVFAHSLYTAVHVIIFIFNFQILHLQLHYQIDMDMVLCMIFQVTYRSQWLVPELSLAEKECLLGS